MSGHIAAKSGGFKPDEQIVSQTRPKSRTFSARDNQSGPSRESRGLQNTITKLLINAGRARMAYHDAKVRNVKAKRVQVDENWSFVYSKQNNVQTPKAASEGAGGVWTWAAVDADSKLILSYLFVGGRDAEWAMWFMDDLRSRLATRVQLTSDGHSAYLEAGEGAFGGDVDYAQLVKMYGTAPDVLKGRYRLPICTGVRRTRIEGDPAPKYVCTSCVERHKLTIRMHMRRFTRLTNAFSKKVKNHAHSVALHIMYYNFVRLHSELRMTPAMAAGVSDRPWEIGDIVMLVEDAEANPGKRIPYKENSN